MNSYSMELNIQRFAEGGAGDGSGESATLAQSQETGEDAGNTADNTSVAGENKNDSTDNGEDAVTLDSIFEKYPELKKEADKRTQKAVQGRVHQLNKSMQSQNDIIDKLMVHHNVKSVDELSERLDASLAEDFAIENGVTEDVGKELLDLRVKRMQDDRVRERQEVEMKVQQQLNIWEEEAKKVKEVYPDFDLEEELKNPQFANGISNSNSQYHASMKQIYEMIHHDEIVEAAKRDVAAAYARSTAQIQSRPSENGLGNQAAVNGQGDVSKLTKKERAELAKRAARGEKIVL